MSSCQICTLPYTKFTRRAVACSFCNFEACRACCERYITTNHSSSCMNTSCTKQWDRRFISDHFSDRFLTTQWEKMIQEISYDQQVAMFPQTMATVASMKRQNEIRNEIRKIKMARIQLDQQDRLLRVQLNNTCKEKSCTYRRPCPSECKGFLSEPDGKCGLCQTIFLHKMQSRNVRRARVRLGRRSIGPADREGDTTVPEMQCSYLQDRRLFSDMVCDLPHCV